MKCSLKPRNLDQRDFGAADSNLPTPGRDTLLLFRPTSHLHQMCSSGYNRLRCCLRVPRACPANFPCFALAAQSLAALQPVPLHSQPLSPPFSRHFTPLHVTMWRRVIPRFFASPPTGLAPAARLRAAARRLFSNGSGAGGGAEGEQASEPRVTLHLSKLKIPGGRDYEEVSDTRHVAMHAVRPVLPLPLNR
jgi:hypothetical protein